MSKSIEKIINDNKIHDSAKKKYKVAFNSYIKYKNDSEFIKYEKIKLEKIIEESIININFISVYITTIALIFTILVTCIFSLNFVISFNEWNFLKLLLSVIYIILILLTLLAYIFVKSIYVKKIFDLRICLEALEDIEKANVEGENNTALEEVASDLINNWISSDKQYVKLNIIKIWLLKRNLKKFNFLLAERFGICKKIILDKNSFTEHELYVTVYDSMKEQYLKEIKTKGGYVKEKDILDAKVTYHEGSKISGATVFYVLLITVILNLVTFLGKLITDGSLLYSVLRLFIILIVAVFIFILLANKDDSSWSQRSAYYTMSVSILEEINKVLPEDEIVVREQSMKK